MTVGKGDDHLVRSADNVPVGHNDSGRIHDEARACSNHFVLLALHAVMIALLQRGSLDLRWNVIMPVRAALGNGNVHNGRNDLTHKRRKTQRTVFNQQGRQCRCCGGNRRLCRNPVCVRAFSCQRAVRTNGRKRFDGLLLNGRCSRLRCGSVLLSVAVQTQCQHQAYCHDSRCSGPDCSGLKRAIHGKQVTNIVMFQLLTQNRQSS